MFNKKIEVSADKITLALYENGNVKARGGKRTMIRTVKDLKEGYHEVYKTHSGGRYELAPNETAVVGAHNAKNYRQRKKIRKRTVEGLVRNNFDHRNCLFITLHFDPSKYATDVPAEEENEWAIPEDWVHVEYDLVKLYDDIFSPGKEQKEIEAASPEVKITNEGYQNIDICHAEFKKFIQRMNYRYENFKYVAVFNRQENTKNWHYHMICNLDYIEWQELKEIWGQGGVYVRGIRSKTGFEKVLKYCKNNMIFASGSLRNEKGYYASRGLNRNKVFRSWKGNETTELERYIQITKQAESAGVKPQKYVTEHAYTGEIRDNPLFVDDEERVCKVKYFTYPIDSSSEFTMTPAKKKKRK